jgi:pyrroloquinoline-quinone synthase
MNGLAIDRLESADALEAALRRIGAERYHILHPFHRLLHGGHLNKGQVQAWALNRYCYQSRIPMKDAALISRCADRELRREWLVRILDHDGFGEQEGGIIRWLRLCEGLGLDPAYVRSEAGLLPATRFAVDAYVRFVREQALLEAIASSLTELFAPKIHEERIPGMLAGYDFVTDDMMAYFRRRLDQAPRDSGFALAYVREHADTPEKRAAVARALIFKCDVLWSQLDALHHAYVLGGGIPPGAFVPADLPTTAREA